MNPPEHYVGLPPPLAPALTQTKYFFQALDNFSRVFAIRPGDEVLFLADPLLDPRVIDAVIGIARSRGAQVRVYMEPSTQVTAIPEAIHGLLKKASFVVSTWFCSILDPLCIQLRREGQRWVKITYFRDLDLLHTPQARFPIEVIGEIIRATAERFPKGEAFDLRFTDTRGSDFRIGFTPEMRENQLATNRWRGKMTAEEDGCYVHYLATHGPNLWDHNSVKNDMRVKVDMSGVLYPQWAVGFARPFEEKIGVVFEGEYISAVHGESEEASILREMLVGGRMIEGGGCGFNPKAPRHTVYPAGSNAPGAMHFGIDLAKPSDYIRRVMPDWEEPPVHMDLITLDATVTAGDKLLVDRGFLCALRDARVVELASRYGDPVELLEAVVL
ncbi:hypothetical protein RD110_25720 [Rhodoferax koreense]|uniref:Uncharacterized protein n=1 Tax=Rhodoferax koreensis TaxID=1842727 RepID=A0A1P8K2F6_9BURK|nr:hypothetical protein [Rhodoferax koreense]APW40180.1 hypothetical protein RD110_25720 [Rhodoferax koreense]